MVGIYTKDWTSLLAASNTLHDLSMLPALVKYRTISRGISRVSSKKLFSYFCYLSEEVISFSLFVEHVLNDVKDQLVKTIISVDGNGDLPKRSMVDLENVAGVNVVNFVIQMTGAALTQLHLSNDFLQMPAGQWKDNTSYRDGSNCEAFKSDHAERESHEYECTPYILQKFLYQKS